MADKGWDRELEFPSSDPSSAAEAHTGRRRDTLRAAELRGKAAGAAKALGAALAASAVYAGAFALLAPVPDPRLPLMIAGICVTSFEVLFWLRRQGFRVPRVLGAGPTGCTVMLIYWALVLLLPVLVLTVVAYLAAAANTVVAHVGDAMLVAFLGFPVLQLVYIIVQLVRASLA